jgi:hypothetical protein
MEKFPLPSNDNKETMVINTIIFTHKQNGPFDTNKLWHKWELLNSGIVLFQNLSNLQNQQS